MSTQPLRFVFLGLSITSSWGNGHATTYRGLLRELAARGHDVLFLERDRPWYADNRDLPRPPYGTTEVYNSLEELQDRFADAVRDADAVIVGSFVPDGVAVGQWVMNTARGLTGFYDIDTPVTMAKLAQGDYEYLTPELISRYRLYLSFTGGPTLRFLEREYGSPQARVLYCSVDETMYYPEPCEAFYDMAYLGTYGEDRQPKVDALLLEPARRWPEGRFLVAGPQYPASITWPFNVQRTEHVGPAEHRRFYNEQRFTLNVTRADMVRAGWAPSVRLFEAAACGTPIVSDNWEGLGSIFAINSEILVASTPEESLRLLQTMPEEQRRAIGDKARQRVLAEHTSAHRAAQLEQYVREASGMAARDKDLTEKAP